VSYYDRQIATHVDGTPIFKAREDEQSERTVAEQLESAWRCQCRSFGRLSPVDWFFVQDGRLVGIGELKTRSHASSKYATVFLNVRKWLALSLAAHGLGVPAVFVVRFTDQIKWISLADIDARLCMIGGCSRTVKSRNDIEPIIEVPIDQMRALTPGTEPKGAAT
jgi:hypothetical protein